MCPAPDAVTIPPSRLRAQLPNGVTLEFDCTGRDAVLVSTVIETLGRCDVPSRR
jgi:transposase